MRSFFWAQSTHQVGWQEPEQGLAWGMSPASLSLMDLLMQASTDSKARFLVQLNLT